MSILSVIKNFFGLSVFDVYRKKKPSNYQIIDLVPFAWDADIKCRIDKYLACIPFVDKRNLADVYRRISFEQQLNFDGRVQLTRCLVERYKISADDLRIIVDLESTDEFKR